MKNKLEKIIEYGIYLIVFFLPWQTRWLFKIGQLNGGFWEYGTMSLYGLDFLVVLTVLAGLIYFFKFKRQGEINSTKWLFLILFLLWSGLSIFWSINPSLSAYYFLRLFLAFGLVFVITVIKPDFKKIALSFVAAGFIQSLLAVWQFFTQNFFASKWLGMAEQTATRLGAAVIEISDMRWLRAYGSFPHPNILAGFLGVSILLAVYLANQDDKRSNYFLFSLPVLLLGMFVSFSRGALLALIVAIVVYSLFLWFKQKEKYIHRPIIIFFLCLIVFSLLLFPFISTRLQATERVEMISQQERLKQLKVAKEIIKKDLFLGQGLGSYTLALEQKFPNFESWFYQPVHNIFLIIWGELGIIGLILFLSFFTLRATTRRVVFFIFSKKTLIERKIIFIPLFLFLVIVAFFDHYLWTLNCGMVLWWLVMGLGFNQDYISKKFK